MPSLLTSAEGRAGCQPGSVPQGLRTEGAGGVWVLGWGAAASRAFVPAGVILARHTVGGSGFTGGVGCVVQRAGVRRPARDILAV